MAHMKYNWVRRGIGAPAQRFGEWYYSLKNRGPEAAVRAARSPSCVAHKLLNWNNSEAAHQHRLTQMRELVGNLVVEVVNSKGKTEHIRAFIASSSRGHHVASLEASEQELDDEEQRCLREMSQMKSRWRSIQLARGVIQAISEVEAQANRRRKRKAA